MNFKKKKKFIQYDFRQYRPISITLKIAYNAKEKYFH